MAKKTYERWRVDLKQDKDGNVTAEKLKMVKSGIKISEEQAETLNAGTLSGYSVAPEMYYLAEVQEDPKKAPVKNKKVKEEVAE